MVRARTMDWLSLLIVVTFALRLKNKKSKSVGVDLQTLLDNFDINAFKKWNEDTKGKSTKWNYKTRLNAILYIMKEKKYENAYQIKQKDVRTLGVESCCSNKSFYKGILKNMIMDVFTHYRIQFDEGKFPKCNKDIRKESDKLLENTPKFTKYDKTPVNVVKEIINDSIQILTSRKKVDVNLNAIIGVVYVMIVVSTNKILYVGSTHNFKKREQVHETSLLKQKKLAKKKRNKLYDYIITNHKNGFDEIEIRPICVCKAGFEIFIEAAFYDILKKELGNKLLNDRRPIDSIYTIDSWTTIYKIVQKPESNVIYVGSSNDLLERKTEHKRICYDLEDVHSSQPVYKHIRSINNNEWPKDIVNIEPVEQCPIFLRDERERFYIDYYDTFNNGFNGTEVIANDEHKEHYVEKGRIASRKENPKSLKIKLIVIFGDKTKAEFESIKAAADALGINQSAIFKFLNGTTKKIIKYPGIRFIRNK